MEALKEGADVLFILLGAILVLAMHAGFAFLELGTVRKKSQVNALVTILVISASPRSPTSWWVMPWPTAPASWSGRSSWSRTRATRW